MSRISLMCAASLVALVATPALAQQAPQAEASPARWIMNASLTLKSESGWSLLAECKNCFDQESIESTLANYSYLNAPRSWTVRAKFAF
jgi:hypothetical protein